MGIGTNSTWHYQLTIEGGNDYGGGHPWLDILYRLEHRNADLRVTTDGHEVIIYAPDSSGNPSLREAPITNSKELIDKAVADLIDESVARSVHFDQ